MIILTPAQAKDLRYLVALLRLTIGVSRQRWAEGDSIRTGRALAAKGLVERAKSQFTNRAATWTPSAARLQYVETNFVRRDEFWVEAVERAIRRLQVFG